MSWLRQIRDDDRGSALIEGAVLTPVLCVLFFGVFEFSFFSYQQHLMTAGVSDAARFVARSCNPTDAATLTNAQNLAATGSIDASLLLRVANWDPGEVTVTFTNVDNSAGTYRGPSVILIVNVTGNFTYAPLGFWGFFGFSIPSVSVTHSERYIGGTLGC